MKLLGVQFSGLGLLENQFIPLRQITMLVGKNNAGKSAVLNAIRALRGLPENAQTSSIFRYSSRDVGIQLFCQPEQNETICPVTSADWWNQFTERHPFELVYKLVALPNFDMVGFESGELLFEDAKALRFLRAANVGIQMDIYQPTAPDELPVQVVQGSTFSTKVISGNDVLHVIPTTGPELLNGLALLQKTFLVMPHRIVAPYLALKTEIIPANDGSNLAQFLHTLQSNNRGQFSAIEAFITDVFPDFESLNIRNISDQARITFNVRGRELEIPLNSCGTGVEQLLMLATLVVTSEKGTLFLMDEPHSFLHPAAERSLIRFLRSQKDKQFVMATHSAVMMNEVPADAIVHIEPPGRDKCAFEHHTTTARILFDLGYRNSDVLFNDRLVVGEGKTEKAVLPVLLEKTKRFLTSDLAKTGFASLDGVPDNAKAQQTAVLRLEHLLSAVGREKQQRLYVFDLDRSTDDANLLKGTNPFGADEPLPVGFLKRMEIENYLLVPEAIARAINEECKLNGKPIQVKAEQVQQELKKLYAARDDEKLFPPGKMPAGDDVLVRIKGSRALDRLYEVLAAASYHKERSGRLIASHVTMDNQPALQDLAELFESIFPRAMAAKMRY